MDDRVSEPMNVVWGVLITAAVTAGLVVFLGTVVWIATFPISISI